MELEKIKDVSTFTNSQIIEVAFSVESLNDKLYAVVRQMNPENTTKENMLCLYELSDDFEPTSRKELIAGEDPRIFSFQNELYCISWNYSQEKNDLEIFVLNLLTNEKTIVQNNVTSHNGKNWVPFVYNDELYFIYSLEPLILLKYNKPNVEIFYNQTSHDQLNRFAWNTGFGNMRAGSKGIMRDRNLCVFTRTGGPDRPHIIHYTEIDFDTFRSHSINLEPNRKSGVHDPYGFFVHKEKTYISTTESEHVWWRKNQTFRNSIYEVLK